MTPAGGVEFDSTGLPLNFGGRTTKLDAQKERAKEAYHKEQSKAVEGHFSAELDKAIARGAARRGVAPQAVDLPPADMVPTWITPSAASPVAAPAVPSSSSSGINPARLARITGVPAPDAAPVTATHGINPARLARMQGITSDTQVGTATAPTAPTGTNELGDDRATIDGRALDSVDATICKGVTKMEVEKVDLDDHATQVIARMNNQEWRKSKKTWTAELLEGGAIKVVQDAVQEAGTGGVDITDLKNTISARVTSEKALNAMAIKAYVEQFPDTFAFIEVTLLEGQPQQKIMHTDQMGEWQEKARAQAERDAQYKPGVNPGVISQWKREGHGIWQKFYGLDRVQIQVYNVLRDMMNKRESAQAKVRSLSTSNIDDIIEWVDTDEVLLGHREGETELPKQHTAWQLHEEQTAARCLKQELEAQLEKAKKRKDERRGDERRDQGRDRDRRRTKPGSSRSPPRDRDRRR